MTTKDAKAPAAVEKGKKEEVKAEEKPKKSALEEDDEFEDFPAMEGWDQQEDVEKNAWEATWEDDDEFEDFAAILKSEYTKRTGAAPMKM